MLDHTDTPYRRMLRAKQQSVREQLRQEIWEAMNPEPDRPIEAAEFGLDQWESVYGGSE